MVWISRGAAPADGRPAIASSGTSFGTGVCFGSLRSLCAMELFQIWMAASDLIDDRVQRCRSPTSSSASTGHEDVFVFSLFFRGLRVIWAGQLPLYPFYMYLYVYASLYGFFI